MEQNQRLTYEPARAAGEGEARGPKAAAGRILSGMSDLIVSVSGIRGIVGRSLTPDGAVRFGQAFGSHAGRGQPILVARDSRPSGEMLGFAVASGLLAVGCEVLDLGVVPTPTVGFAVRQQRAGGAVMVTASHNPAPWNGLKMFGPDGAVLSAAEGEQVRRRFEAGDFARVGWDGFRRFGAVVAVAADHAAAAAGLADEPAVAAAGFRVLLDGNGGAGGPTGRILLDKLGVHVVPLNVDPTGVFVHEAEPIPAHLTGVAEAVRAAGVAVGFVLDPDADRLALIDERGECVSEEATLALAVRYRLSQRVGPMVVNMSTSRMSGDLAAAAGATCARSAVGEANVVARMREVGAVIGGEGNGGVIDPRVGWVRDPFVGMALILSLMATEKKPLSRLVGELPRYAMLKTKFEVSRDRLPTALAAIRAKWPAAAVDTLDGLRLDGPDWWLHVRPSNTEPVVRVIAEAATREKAEALCREAGAVVTG
jgi:phosphomannomutase